MTTRKSGFFALAIATAVLAACESDPVQLPPPAVEVEVVPAAIQVDSGSTGMLVAVVRNATNTAVTWASANTAIATVSATGVVTGVKPGQATITATSAESSGAVGAATVTVLPRAGQGTGEQPIISIRSVTQGSTNNPVAVNNVFGQIDVTVDFELRGAPVSRLEVLVDQTVACSQSFSTSGSVEANGEAGLTIVCSINTAEVDAQGVPRFPNGPHTVSARLVGTTGTVAANSSTNLTFNNVDQLQLSATASGATANDGQGLVWSTGDVTVTATPAVFSGASGAVSRVIFTVTAINDPATALDDVVAVIEDASAPFSATFSRTQTTNNVGQNVEGFESPIIVSATSVTSAGQPGPQGVRGTIAQPALRLDNAAPDDTDADANTVAFNAPTGNWFGANTAINNTRVTNYAELTDEGVNRNTVTLQYNADPAADNDDTGWTAFAASSELPQTTTNAAFAVRAVVCDALNNCTEVGPITAGGDVVAPTIVDATVTPDNIFELNDGEFGTEAELAITPTENLSGFPADFVEVQNIRTTLVGTAVITSCLDVNGAVTNDNDPATPEAAIPNSGCPFDGQPGTTVDLPAVDGYYAVTVRAIDNAGNQSSTISKTFLYDTTDPTATVGGLTFTTNSVSVTGTVGDNLDLQGYDTRLFFGALASLPSGLPTTALSASGSFGLPMTNSVAATGTSAIIRNISDAGFGVGTDLSHVGFGGVDLANNFGSGNIAFSSPGADGFDNAPISIGAPTVSGATSGLCRSGASATACTAPTPDASASATLTVVAVTGPNTANPISTLHFYVDVPSADGTIYPLFIGTDASGDLSITDPLTNNRNWTYTISLPASMLPPIAENGVTYNVSAFAVAVDPDGDAYKTANSAAITVR